MHRTEPPRVCAGLRGSAQTLRREPRNRLISVFLTTNSFFCAVFFIRQLVHIMQIGFPPKNSFWRAPELLYELVLQNSRFRRNRVERQDLRFRCAI